MAPTLKQLKKAKWIEDFNANEFKIIGMFDKQAYNHMVEHEYAKIDVNSYFDKCNKALGIKDIVNNNIRDLSMTEEDFVNCLTKVQGFFEEDISFKGNFIYIDNYAIYNNVDNFNDYYAQDIDDLVVHMINFNTKTIWLYVLNNQV